jgi:hypothetical protein
MDMDETQERGAPRGRRRTEMRRLVPGLIGVVLAPLGLLWTLQGAGVVQMRPILCVAHCEPVTRSDAWLLVGAVTCAAGVALAARGARRLRRAPAA